MDPNATLQAIRNAIAYVGDTESEDLSEHDIAALLELATSVSALDSWLSNGGFLPKAWSENRHGNK